MHLHSIMIQNSMVIHGRHGPLVDHPSIRYGSEL